jgi:phage/plasmid-associated DNA primase/DNA-directed RNA polymerase subunit RPC12/RpoP
MSKERIILTDGAIDISGPYIMYTPKEPEEEKQPCLPYTTRELMDAKAPVQFFDFLTSMFPEEKTVETVLNYLSLIVSKNTEFKYGGIFVGPPHTGKTTLLEILSKALPGYILFSTMLKFKMSPADLAILDGVGAAVLTEINGSNKVNSFQYKMLTGGGALTAKRPYHEAYGHIPTAQIIMVNNRFPQFDRYDEALAARIVIIPFLVPHLQGEPGTMLPQNIIKNLQAEFPAIIKLLAGYYVRLKYKLNGVIPLSKQCKKIKKEYFGSPFCLKCEHCMEHFHAMDSIIENDGLHCPYCGSVMAQVQTHVSRRGKK